MHPEESDVLDSCPVLTPSKYTCYKGICLYMLHELQNNSNFTASANSQLVIMPHHGLVSSGVYILCHHPNVVGLNPDPIKHGVRSHSKDIYLYCRPDCPNCPANTIQMGQATWVV